MYYHTTPFTYPHTNLNEPNLDWIIHIVKDNEKRIDEFTALNRVHFEGEHNPNKQYSIWAVVEDGNSGDGYIAIKSVPRNVILSNTSYWAKVSSYSALYTAFNTRISTLESDNTTNKNNISNAQTAIEALQGSMATSNAKISAIEKMIGNAITPELFGAVGDGEHDDTEAIQAAINAAAAGTENVKTVYFPHKSYRVTDTINIDSSRIILYGNPSNEQHTEILADGVTDVLFNVTKPIVGFYYLNLRPMDDDFINITGVKYDMIPPYDCDGEFIRCSVYNFATGIELIGKNLNVFNSEFSHCNIGIDVEVTAASASAYYRGLYINGCRFHNCGEHDDYSDDTACIKYNQSAATVINQFFISDNYADLGCTFIRGQLQGGVISNNYIVNVHNDGIVCDNISGVVYKDNAIPVIINNYIATTASPNSEYGIFIKNGYRCIIQGNTLASFSKSAIHVENASGTTISNNIIFATGSEYNINIIGAAHCIVHNNIEQYSATAPSYSLRCTSDGSTPLACDYQGGRMFGDIKIALPSETITGGGSASATLCKIGNIVTLKLNGATDGAQTTDDPILTLPKKYRPIDNLEILSTYDSARLVLYSDTGYLTFGGSDSGNHPLRGYFTYITKE